MILAGFPNPVGWAADEVAGAVGDAATAGFEVLVGGLTAWVLDAVVWVVTGVFRFFVDAADPNVEADWFAGGNGPYATTAAVGATLLVGFVLVGVAQGVLTGDVGGMARQVALHLPLSVLAMVGVVTVTQVLVRLTDELSTAVLANFDADVQRFTHAVGSVAGSSGGTGTTAFVVFLFGLVAVLTGVVLVAELAVRSALVYVVVALAPLVFAAQLWPAMRGVARRLLELLVALVVSKLVVAVALAVAAAAAVGTGSGGEVTALPAPEVAAEDPGGSVTQAVGILLAAAAAFGVAAFSPLLVAKLLPLTEAALVAQGVRGGPVRAGQTALALGSYGRAAGARLDRVATGRIGSAPAAAPGPPGTAAAPVAAAAAGAGVAAGAARAATRTVGDAATATATGASASGPGGDRRTQPASRPTAPAGGGEGDRG